MGMEEIHPDSYSSFIKKHFKDSKRTISDDAIAYVLHVTGNETYAVQKICNAIFESNIPNVTLPVVKEIFKKVLIEQQSYFERIRTLLKADSVQFKLLRAVAKQDIVLEPTGKKFMSSNSFTNSSSILKALKSLESYSLVSKVIVENKGLGYYINDALFRAWLSTLPV